MSRLTQISTIIITAILIAGCKKDPIEPPVDESLKSAEVASCAGCHSSYTNLKAVASPDTAAAGGGCGGEAPHIEPYDRVYLAPEGYAEFKTSTHGRLGCVFCHGGVDGTSNKSTAHSGTFVNHPSKKAETLCKACHATETERMMTSIHQNGWGQKSMVSLRHGVASFDDLSANVKAGYDVNCAKCHGGCGECHVNRPKAGGGGLLNGHKFGRVPDMREQCVACHTSRGGHAYFGIASGTVPDVHLGKLGNGGHCLGCHSGTELHGNGTVYDQRYKYPLLPKCERCHPNVATSNQYHTAHASTFSCNVCHSQDYNNCGSCHIGGEGARIPS